MARHVAPGTHEIRHRTRKGVLTAGEIAALLGKRQPVVQRMVDAGELIPTRLSGGEQARYDRHDVERVLLAQLTGRALDAARRDLVRLSYHELRVDAADPRLKPQLVETGVEPHPASAYLDEELRFAVRSCRDDHGADPKRAEWTTWASTRGLPDGITVQRRLGHASWRSMLRACGS